MSAEMFHYIVQISCYLNTDILNRLGSILYLEVSPKFQKKQQWCHWLPNRKKLKIVSWFSIEYAKVWKLFINLNNNSEFTSKAPSELFSLFWFQMNRQTCSQGLVSVSGIGYRKLFWVSVTGIGYPIPRKRPDT